jgi:hypothetical protein
MIDVNVRGLLNGTAAALPQFERRCTARPNTPAGRVPRRRDLPCRFDSAGRHRQGDRYAIDEPAEVDVNEVVIRPARQR